VLAADRKCPEASREHHSLQEAVREAILRLQEEEEAALSHPQAQGALVPGHHRAEASVDPSPVADPR